MMRVILLAAGLSSRMNGENKLLKGTGGACLMEAALTNALSYSDDVLVVTGHEAERMKAFLSSFPVKTLFNKDYLQGQETSIRIALEQECGPVMILPSDLPFIRAEDYIRCEKELKGRIAARPAFNNNAGHPVALSPEAVRIYKEQKTLKLRDLLIKTGCHFYEGSEASVTDIDTPEAYEAFIRRKKKAEH